MTNKTHANGARIDDAKKFTSAQKKLIRENIAVSKIIFTGEGTQVQFRSGFFYRNGYSTSKLAERIGAELEKLGLQVYLVDNYEATGEHYNAWPRDSFWQVTFMLADAAHADEPTRQDPLDGNAELFGM